MRFVSGFLVVTLLFVTTGGVRADEDVKLRGSLQPFLKVHCLGCHDSESKKGGLDLSAEKVDFSSAKGLAKWVRIHDRIASGEMPPGKGRQPPAEARDPFLKTLAAGLTVADIAQKNKLLRRLNRVEYENTLRDLLGVPVEVKGMLPEDGSANGFDNVRTALDLSSVHLQRYLDAAEKALDEAIRKLPQPKTQSETVTLIHDRTKGFIQNRLWLKRPDGAVVVFTAGYPPASFVWFRASADGIYRLNISGYGYQTKDPLIFALHTGAPFDRAAGMQLQSHHELQGGKMTTVKTEVFLKRGETFRLTPHVLGHDFWRIKAEKYQGPGMAIKSVDVEGPLAQSWPGVGHERLFGKLPIQPIKAQKRLPGRRFNRADTLEIESQQPQQDAERLLAGFAPLAFRQTVGKEQLAPYLQLVKAQLEEGARFEEAMRTGYIAMLCSPDFLFLHENDGKLDDFALASRLSYFLWSSAPDAELLELARRDELGNSGVLKAQTERMLKDGRARRLTENFVGQWLDLRNLTFTVPDQLLYPEFDEMLEEAMVHETEGFFDEVLHKNLSIYDFINSDWTIANERLASHYGIDGVKGVKFRKIKLRPEHHRGGVLTHASVLRVSANGTNTSPVVRGAWVLDRILGTPPPPPPPGIPGVEPDIRGATTLREQLAKHRDLASCASCHRSIDPPGFALENYDVIGGWRENYRSKGTKFPYPKNREINGRRANFRVGPAVDASGVTEAGQTFNDFDEYRKLLLSNRKQFARALTTKLAVYATGRGMGFSDRAAIEGIVARLEAQDQGLRTLVIELVQSDVFRMK